MTVVRFPSKGYSLPDRSLDASEEVTLTQPKRALKKRRHKKRKITPAQVIARSVSNRPKLRHAEKSIYQMFDNVIDGLIDQPQKTTKTAPLKRYAPTRRKPTARCNPIEKIFWGVWLRHEEALKKYSMKLMRHNKDDAEDALSIAMLKASTTYNAHKIRDEKAWLCRFVYNSCMDLYRNRSKYGGGNIMSHDSFSTDTSEHDAHHVKPEDNLLSLEYINLLKNHISQMPDTLKWPLILKLENTPYETIASELDISNATARKRVQLARKWLNEKLTLDE